MPGPDRPVVLALDWCDPSVAAIDLARELAADWDAPLVVVAAVATETPPPASATRAAPTTGSEPHHPGATQAPGPTDHVETPIAVRALRYALGETAQPATRVVVAAGAPAAVVNAHARTAGLVVVGSHGRGALRTRLLGSVSQQLLHSCPVTIAVAHGHHRPGDH